MANTAATQYQLIEGQVPLGQYQFVRKSYEDNAIEHGQIIQNNFQVDASFLHFRNRDDARNVHDNLSRLKGEAFLRSYFVIEEGQSCFWIAVEKIDFSLVAYKISHQPFPLRSRLCPKYQDIIRDIIKGMCQLHAQNYTHGGLLGKYIMIINHRAKFAFIRNDSGTMTDFANLKTIFTNILGESPNDHDELKHFHQRAKVTNKMALRKLYFHPLLMSSGERFLLPLRADTRLYYRENPIQFQIYKFEQLFHGDVKWMRYVPKDQQHGYMTVLNERQYQDTAWDLFKFVRNTIVHINENICARNQQVTAIRIQRKTEAAVENDLSSMFPYLFVKLYDLLDLHEITPSIRMHFWEN